MHVQKPMLADQVLAAFELACKERDLEIAEYLLRALEVLDARAELENAVQIEYSALDRKLRRQPQ